MKPGHRIRAKRLRTGRSRRKVATDGAGSRAPAEQSTSTEDRARAAQQHEAEDAGSLAFYTLDRKGCITAVNNKGAELLGFARKWLLRKSFLVFVARQDVEVFVDLLKQTARMLTPCKIGLDLYGAGKTYAVEIEVRTSLNDGTMSHSVTALELPPALATGNLAREPIPSWRSLVSNASDIILAVKADGEIRFVNQPAWGYSTKSMVGTNLNDYIPPAGRMRIAHCLHQAFLSQRRMVCELTGVAGDRRRWFSFGFGVPERSGLSQRSPSTRSIPVIVREISAHKQTEETLRMSGTQMREFAAKLEAVREEERSRVAREIHDELGQSLTALKLSLSWIEGKVRGVPRVRREMKTIAGQVDETIEKVRRIAAELRPPVLDDLGLLPAIEWQVSEFRKRTRIRAEVVANIDGLQLSTDAAVAIFRVVQEALTNVMRHANATRVRISLSTRHHAVAISITDNGKGMTRQQETDLKSLGIVGMKERISRLGGELRISSTRGEGTRLDITVPTAEE